LRRVTEPRETAFTILVPAGWRFEGGILRVNPLTTNGPANTLGAKSDFTVKRDAAVLTVTYQEGGIQYQEKLTTLIEDMGPASQGMWSNKDTLVVRAPAAEFDRLARWFSIIPGSIQLNLVWVAGEMRGQRQRAAAAQGTQLYLQDGPDPDSTGAA